MLDCKGASQRLINACAMHLALSKNAALQYRCSQTEIVDGAANLANGDLPEQHISEWLFICGNTDIGVYIGSVFDSEDEREILFNTDFSKPTFNYDALWQEYELADAYNDAAGVLLINSNENFDLTRKMLVGVFERINPPGHSAVLLPDENALLERIFDNHSDYNRTQYILPSALPHRDNSPIGLEENDLILNELASDEGFLAVNNTLGTSNKAWFYSNVFRMPETDKTLGIPNQEAPYENALLWLLQRLGALAGIG